MKKIYTILITTILIAGIAFAAIPLSNRTWIRVGSLQSPFDAWGAERGWDANRSIYEGLLWPAWYDRSDNFVIDRQFMACRNFTTPGGEVLNYKSAKFSTGSSTSQIVPQVLEQEGKYPYCDITVDGTAQFVEDYLNGNVNADLEADRVVTNIIRSGLGVTMTRRVLAFSQPFHDNYFIYEYTFENTGNIDDDDDIEVSNTIEDFYFGLISRYCTSREAYYVTNLRQASWGAHQWVYHTPMDEDPEIPYFYTWLGQAKTADITVAYDNIGAPVLPAEAPVDEARIRCPQFAGMGVLHVDNAYNDPAHNETKIKTGWYIGDGVPPEGADQQAWGLLNSNYEGRGIFDTPQDEYAGHMIGDRMAPYSVIKDVDAAGTNSYLSFGPWNIPHGESVKIVLTEGVSGMDRKTSMQVGQKWYKAYQGATVDFDMPPAPEYRDPEPVDPEAPMMDVYKDKWVYTGKDSIVQTFHRAKKNYDSGYGITFPPPPPVSFDVIPQPDKVVLEWSDNSMEDGDFEGYRVYRAMLEPDSFYHKIFDCSVTEGNVATRYEDKSLLRGINYYYYVTAYKIDPVTGQTIESGRAYTQTTIPASLKKPPRDIADDGRLISDIAQMYAAGELSDAERLDAVLGMIRVVPNPYNIQNRKITFGTGSDKDKLMFYNLPENCMIRIYTERGDLVDEIEHVTAPGMSPVADEAWYSSTDSRQVVKSGVYIAHIQVTEDIMERETSLPLLFKGESIVKKFIVIR
jgi:hypothetical protein